MKPTIGSDEKRRQLLEKKSLTVLWVQDSHHRRPLLLSYVLSVRLLFPLVSARIATSSNTDSQEFEQECKWLFDEPDNDHTFWVEQTKHAKEFESTSSNYLLGEKNNPLFTYQGA